MNKKGKLIISLSVVFILIIAITLVLAKYIKNDNSDIGVSSQEFYFTSDYLDVEKTDKTYAAKIIPSKFSSFNLRILVLTLPRKS